MLKVSRSQARWCNRRVTDALHSLLVVADMVHAALLDLLGVMMQTRWLLRWTTDPMGSFVVWVADDVLLVG